jgi:hypothetical protein
MSGNQEFRELVLGFAALSGAAKVLQAAEVIVTRSPGPKQHLHPSLTVIPISKGHHLAFLMGRVQILPGMTEVCVDADIAAFPAQKYWVLKICPV